MHPDIEAIRAHQGLIERLHRCLAPDAHLQPPWLASSDDGSLGVEWRCDARRLCMTYDRSGTIDYYAYGPGFEDQGLILATDEIERLARWVLTGQLRE